ncbi:MAG: PIN domain-containing protein [Akkermansiaceae bacterium]
MEHSSIHLDTNYLVYFTNGGNEAAISQIESWLRGNHKLFVSAMAWAEFQCGSLSVREHDMAHDVIHGVLPVTLEIANRAGFLFQATGRRSRSLPDCMIAATAISEGVPLATMNQGDFLPFLPHGLILL